MVSSVTLPSSSASRVVIGGMTMRFLISTAPMRAGVRSGFMALTLVSLPRTDSRPLSRLRGRAGRAHHLRMRVGLPPPGLPRKRGRGADSECLHLAAVHVDGGAVQPAAARGDHEGDEAGDVLR